MEVVPSLRFRFVLIFAFFYKIVFCFFLKNYRILYKNNLLKKCFNDASSIHTFFVSFIILLNFLLSKLFQL